MKRKYFLSVLFNSENHHTSQITLMFYIFFKLVGEGGRRNESKGNKEQAGRGGKGSKTLEGPNAVKKPSCFTSKRWRTVLQNIRACPLPCFPLQGCLWLCRERGQSYLLPRDMSPFLPKKEGTAISVHPLIQPKLLRSGLLVTLESVPKGDSPWDLYNV